MDRRKELLLRVYVVFFAFVAFSGVILYQVFKISFVEGEYWREKAVNNLEWRKVKAERGDIFSEDGNVLATDVTFFDIYMDLTVSSDKDFRENIDSLSFLLAKYSNKDRSNAKWKKLLSDGRKAGLERNKPGTKYYPIARNLDYLEKNRFAKFPLFRKGQMRGGIIVQERRKRAKPFGSMGSRVIGLDRENSTKVGLEGSFDQYLSGETQDQLMKEISYKVWVPVESSASLQLKSGFDIVTTINSDIQDVVHHELLKALQHHEAEAGTAIVMDVKTGAIKAMSNFTRNVHGNYLEIQNHAVLRLNEPGSTIKLASTLALLEDGAATPDTKVNLNGGVKKFKNLIMRDSEVHGLYESDLRTAFAKSSNVGLGTLADDHFNIDLASRKKFVWYYKKFGLGAKTKIDLNGEQFKYIKDPEINKDEFYGTSVAWMAHGYELEMTPLQVLNFYNTVANDGKMMKPYLVSEILDRGQRVKEIKPQVLDHQIAKLHNIHQCQQLLADVVEFGTARRLKSKNYSFAGKTGTSKDYGVKLEGDYPYNASFAGYFPAENPQYSIIVVVYHPKKNGYYGGIVAGPVFRGIADKIFALFPDFKESFYKDDRQYATNYYKPDFAVGSREDITKILQHCNVPFKKETKSAWAIMNPYEEKIAIQKRSIKVNEVPNIVGMGLKDAMYVLENLGLQVQYTGAGKVVTQSIQPGTKINGQTIYVRLG